jgi:hypothetical protein
VSKLSSLVDIHVKNVKVDQIAVQLSYLRSVEQYVSVPELTSFVKNAGRISPNCLTISGFRAIFTLKEKNKKQKP